MNSAAHLGEPAGETVTAVTKVSGIVVNITTAFDGRSSSIRENERSSHQMNEKTH